LTTNGQLGLKVKFTWDFATTAPAIKRQDAKTQQVVQQFSAFFTGKIDLPTLQARLAEQQN